MTRYSLLLKHDYNHNDINHREKMKRIKLANLNGHKLSFLLKLSAAARPKRKERIFSTQITPQEKDPAMGINGFEGVGPESLLFQKKDGPCLRFLKEIGFEGGERETDLWVHALFEIAPVFFQFSFLFFLFSFLSFFFWLLLCSFLSLRKRALFSIPLLQGTARAFL